MKGGKRRESAEQVNTTNKATLERTRRKRSQQEIRKPEEENDNSCEGFRILIVFVKVRSAKELTLSILASRLC